MNKRTILLKSLNISGTLQYNAIIYNYVFIIGIFINGNCKNEKLIVKSENLFLESKMKKNIYDFKIIIEPDDSGGFVVNCPSLQGCYSQGNTIDEALVNIKEAIMLCLEDMESTGQEIPNPSKSLIGSVLISK